MQLFHAFERSPESPHDLPTQSQSEPFILTIFVHISEFILSLFKSTLYKVYTGYTNIAIFQKNRPRPLSCTSARSPSYSIVLILRFRALVVLRLLVHLLDSLKLLHLSLDELWIRGEVVVAASKLEVVVSSESELARIAIKSKGIWIIASTEASCTIVIANIAIREPTDEDLVIAAVRQDVTEAIIVAVADFITVAICISRL